MNYFDQRDRHRVMQREIRRLDALGYHVTVEPVMHLTFNSHKLYYKSFFRGVQPKRVGDIGVFSYTAPYIEISFSSHLHLVPPYLISDLATYNGY